MTLSGKVALITGGGRGIGLAIARGLATDGCDIAIMDSVAEVARDAARHIADLGVATIAVACDVVDVDAVRHAADLVCRELGGVDFLVNNAGRHLLDFARPPTALSSDLWRELLDVYVIGPVNCARAYRATMRARGGGVIVNIGSIAGIVPDTAYGVSKLAVAGLTVALAKELGEDGIRVCGVAPGLVDSPAAMAGLPADRVAAFVRDHQLVKRPGQMTDVVAAVRFLLSDDAGFITGETLTVSGGFPLHV